MLEEREYKFLEILSREGQHSQRHLAQSAGLSLGLTNLVLKNLVRRGYVKIKGLNKRKVRYILTPHGFSEKFKKSYKYTVKTIDELSKYKVKIQDFVRQEYESGTRELTLVGRGELSDIAEIALRNLSLSHLKWERIFGHNGGQYFLKGRKEKTDIMKILLEGK